ncbi:hypothetical protein PTKIN_Ptkin04bG0023900 [Pterospermum kingtungense]
MGSILYSPKLLFLVGNLIVVVLIGESKYFASGSGDVVYDEYVDHQSRSLRNSSKIKPFEENLMRSTCMVSVTERVQVEEIREVIKKEKNEVEGQHEVVLPTEELNKRADDFIARIRRQRRLELLRY